MRKIFFVLSMVVFFFAGNTMKAQDLSVLDYKSYHVIVLDSESEDILLYDNGGTIVQDLRPDWDYEGNPDGGKALYIWENTYASNPAVGKGAFGQVGGFYDFQAQAGWSGLGFCMRDATVPAAFDVDFTDIRANSAKWRFHMAVQSPNAAGSHAIQAIAGSAPEAGDAARFSVGAGMVDGRVNKTPGFTANTWHIVDMSMDDMIALGWNGRAPFRGNYFVVLSGGAPNRIMFDAVFYYNTEPKGIKGTTVNKLRVVNGKGFISVLDAPGTVDVFTLTGVKVRSGNTWYDTQDLAKGTYIIKSGGVAEKFIVK